MITNPENKRPAEDLMDMPVPEMSDKELEFIHGVCLRRIQAVESEIARRKEQRSTEEGGFAE